MNLQSRVLSLLASSSVALIIVCYNKHAKNQLQSLDLEISNMPRAEASLERTAKFDTDTPPPCGEVCSYGGQPAPHLLQTDPNTPAPYSPISKNFNCDVIMRRMAYSGKPVSDNPPRQPPADLLDDFTQHGEFPIKQTRYMAELSTPNHTVSYTRRFIEDLRRKAELGIKVNEYKTNGCLQDLILNAYAKDIANTSSFVIGTQTPWLESILLAAKSRRITTLEYGDLALDHPHIAVRSPHDHAEKYFEGSERFDVGVSFSSIEHSGLGRYGDPLAPHGDLEAMAQAWCMLRPAGLFFLGVPSPKPGEGGNLIWNAHRLYGASRLSQLAANWELIDWAPSCQDTFRHQVLVLRKPATL